MTIDDATVERTAAAVFDVWDRPDSKAEDIALAVLAASGWGEERDDARSIVTKLERELYAAEQRVGRLDAIIRDVVTSDVIARAQRATENGEERVPCFFSIDWIGRCIAALSAPPAPAPSFQARVQPWMMECFGEEISADISERCHRLYEEVGETVQALGMTRSEAHQLVDYTWDREAGKPAQEIGGVMVTLAALCLAAGLDMHECGEVELVRAWGKIETIRAKQAAKPKHSPLPAPAPERDGWRPTPSPGFDHSLPNDAPTPVDPPYRITCQDENAIVVEWLEGEMKGKTARFILTPPSAAYFNEPLSTPPRETTT
jgi:hypothetical protein